LLNVLLLSLFVATSDSNHMTLDSLLVTSTTLEDHITTDTIPEEGALELGDSPYRPILSPSTEELPSLPSPEENSVSSEPSAPVTTAAHVPPDLAAQIQQLQRELENCRHPENHTHSAFPTDNATPTDSGFAESPVDVEFIEPIAAIPVQSENHIPPEPLADASESAKEPENPTEEIPIPKSETIQPKKPSRHICRAIAIGLFVAFVVLGIVALLVLESELDIPVVKDIRMMPEVQDFKQQQYLPFKSSVSHKFGGNVP
jgi:hypothetical protein